MSRQRTRAPALTNALQVANPRPEPAPVTTATLPSGFMPLSSNLTWWLHMFLFSHLQHWPNSFQRNVQTRFATWRFWAIVRPWQIFEDDNGPARSQTVCTEEKNLSPPSPVQIRAGAAAPR